MNPKIPKAYRWLEKEKAPKMLVEALKIVGTVEVPGKGSNPFIIKWAKEVGEDVYHVYKSDEIPWCGLSHAVIAKRAGKEIVKDPLWALNWGSFGEFTEVPMLGDTLVFVRKTATGGKAGHVGLYVGEDSEAFHVLGGNQSNMYGFSRIAKNRLYVARCPMYSIAMPKNVRRIFLTATGKISTNEQ